MHAAVAESLPLFVRPDEVFEVRALDAGRPGRKVVGFVLGEKIPKVARAIATLAADAGGVYFTPQRLAPDVLARSRHHFAPVVRDGDEVRPRPASDEDVTARRYLIIDVDPVRPAEFKKHSATDAEKAAAWDLAGAVRGYLAGKRWPAPLVVDSGNGWHLYYRLPEELPGGPADSAADPVAVLLRVLKARFDTPAAEIDPTVFNASRIMKIPSTPARKGPHTADRPHRVSRVTEVPREWQP